MCLLTLRVSARSWPNRPQRLFLTKHLSLDVS